MLSTTQTRPFNLLNSRYFWAFVLIGIGGLLLMAEFYRFSVPVFRLIVAIVLVTSGLQLVLKAANFRPKIKNRSDQALMIGSGKQVILPPQVKNRYLNLLGSQVLDFRHLHTTSAFNIEVTTVLGETHLYLPRFPGIQFISRSWLGKVSGSKGFGAGPEADSSLTYRLNAILGNITVHSG
jgi:hypothetical protein